MLTCVVSGSLSSCRMLVEFVLTVDLVPALRLRSSPSTPVFLPPYSVYAVNAASPLVLCAGGQMRNLYISMLQIL